jgi:hypothetical protein
MKLLKTRVQTCILIAETWIDYSISKDPQVVMMWNMFTPRPVSSSAPETTEIITHNNIPHPANDIQDVLCIHESFAPVVTYLSGESDKDDIDDDPSDLSDGNDNQCVAVPSGNWLPIVLPLKQHCLDIPYCMQRKLKQEERMLKWGEALVAIDKLLASKKTKFISRPQGLQACHILAIQSHLQIVVKNQWYSIDASEHAAESHGFAAKHGGRLLQSWNWHWTISCKLPILMHGHHAKIYTLLSDPSIAAELWAYVRSKKWAMDPAKLAKFAKNELLPNAAAKAYHTWRDAQRSQKNMEIELFPRIHPKVGWGISLSTACRWLHLEGFQYTSHKKVYTLMDMTIRMLSL